MTAHTQRLLDEALALPQDEREALVEALCVSLQDPPAVLRPSWEKAVQERLAELAQGRSELVPWAEVEARLRRTIARE
ncbi:MAG: addiction module protein [Nannocystis sp.]|nr:addiction module protein [Nannocystis sp.]